MKLFSPNHAIVLALAWGLDAQTPKPATPAKPPATKPAAPGPKPAAPSPKAAPASEIQGQPAATAEKPGEMPDSTVIVTIGEDKITKGEFERFIANLPPQVQQQLANQPKRAVAEDLAALRVLAAEAKKRKLDQNDTVKQQIQLQLDNILVSALYRDIEGSVKTSDADAQAYFDAHKSEFEQVKARHILIRFQGSAVPLRPNTKDLTKEEALAKAKQLKAQLTAGAKFDELAKKESDDTGSGQQGGDLGTFGHGMMVPQFDQAVFALKQGEISEPLETQFGYHIIEAQELVGRNLAGVKDQVLAKMKPDSARKAMDDIRKSTAVKFNDAYFPAVTPPAAAPVPPAPPQE